MVGTKVVLRTRMSAADAHYAGELVEGAHIVTAWGDVATELAIRMFGDEGLFVGYSEVRYTAPVYAGDFMEYVGWIEKKGNTSITCHFEAYKYIQIPSVLRVLQTLSRNPSSALTQLVLSWFRRIAGDSSMQIRNSQRFWKASSSKSVKRPACLVQAGFFVESHCRNAGKIDLVLRKYLCFLLY